MTDTPVACARRALDFVKEGQTLGLGTGRAATAFVVELGRRVAEGLRVRGVATSEATAASASSAACVAAAARLTWARNKVLSCVILQIK